MQKLVLFIFSLAMARDLTFARDVIINGEISVAQVDACDTYKTKNLHIKPASKITFYNPRNVENARVIIMVEKDAIINGIIACDNVDVTLITKGTALLENATFQTLNLNVRAKKLSIINSNFKCFEPLQLATIADFSIDGSVTLTADSNMLIESSTFKTQDLSISAKNALSINNCNFSSVQKESGAACSGDGTSIFSVLGIKGYLNLSGMYIDITDSTIKYNNIYFQTGCNDKIFALATMQTQKDYLKPFISPISIDKTATEHHFLSRSSITMDNCKVYAIIFQLDANSIYINDNCYIQDILEIQMGEAGYLFDVYINPDLLRCESFVEKCRLSVLGKVHSDKEHLIDGKLPRNFIFVPESKLQKK